MIQGRKVMCHALKIRMSAMPDDTGNPGDPAIGRDTGVAPV